MNFGNLIKRHSVLIIAGALSLCAVVVFAMTILMSSSLKKKVNSESIKIGNNINTLSKTVVSRQQAAIESKYQEAFEADANEISNFGAQGTLRQLLSYDIFPKPQYISQQIFNRFGENYIQNLENLIYRMIARDCPSDNELNALKPAGRADIGRGQGNIYSDAEKEIEKIACDQRAEEIKTYANPVNMANYTAWENWNYNDRTDYAIDDCWRTQLAFWIQEDIADTIAAMNGFSENVLTSPVKRLLGISFNNKTIGAGSGQTRYAMRPGGFNPSGGMAHTGTTTSTNFDFPQYVTSDASATSTIGTKAWTTRVCNDDIDVVHFSMAVIVEHQKVLSFMKELCSSKEHKFRGFSGDLTEKTLRHNQITILESALEPVVNSDPQHKRYRYGNNPVVRLNLVCEYTFRRAGYDKIKPESIKEELGQLKPNPQGSRAINTRNRPPGAPANTNFRQPK